MDDEIVFRGAAVPLQVIGSLGIFVGGMADLLDDVLGIVDVRGTARLVVWLIALVGLVCFLAALGLAYRDWRRARD